MLKSYTAAICERFNGKAPDFSRKIFRSKFPTEVGTLTDLPAADRRHDANISRAVERRIQHFVAPDDAAVHKNVHVLPDLALLSQDPIAQPAVAVPKLVQSFAYRRRLRINLYFGVAASEVGQMACDLKSNHLPQCASKMLAARRLATPTRLPRWGPRGCLRSVVQSILTPHLLP